MMLETTGNDKGTEALNGRECDWSTLVCLARRVIRSASLAVMAHAELDARRDGGEEGKDA